MNSIPNDPVMLLSYLNTQLRDFYPSLEECCKSLSLEQDAVQKRLEQIGFHYHPADNRFV